VSTLPHDIPDLYLSPVVLALDARIQELASLDLPHLREEVALVSDMADWTRDMRETALLRAVGYLIDCHGWDLAWDQRGIRLTHRHRHIVLGVPVTFAEFLSEPAPGSVEPRSLVRPD
jgi:hypothetical protein